MEILVLLLIFVVLPAALIWGTVQFANWMVGHDFYCTCPKCREKTIREEVMRREWRGQKRDIEQAVEELFKERGR